MQKQFVIQNQLGLHVRPAKQLVAQAMQYSCSIFIEKDGAKFNAKSLVNVLTAGIKYGDSVTLITEGEGEAEAIQALGELLVAPIESKPAQKGH
ncbi:HPr family phosphocarrier protein [Paenibacillus sp. 2TAB23]|uniref:HPr family phosphocarrier protein n=1 Tax=Paenibacillus sp. 2TAB23 TaxID=3233004 RepID=UPI003F95CFCB